MKKVLKMLIVMFIIYFIIQIGFSLFGTGHEVSYKINDIEIKEIFTNNTKGEVKNYYLDINVDGVHYYIQTYHDFHNSKKIIKDIKKLNTANSSCILPIYRNDEIVTDIICKVAGKNIYYRNIKGGDAELDNLVSNIKEYNFSKWNNNLENPYKLGTITLYKNNMLNDYLIGINSYKGLYTISENNVKGLIEVNIFNKDIYTRKISGTVKSTYVTADYESNYTFNKFYTLKLDSKNVETIKSNYDISFDSYVQGIIDNSMYVFDKDSKVQYEVNIKSKTVTIVGNVSMGIKFYNNGVWETKSAYDASSSEMMFINNVADYVDSNYIRIDKHGNTKSGFYYLYQREGNYYKVYRSNVQNKEDLTYLFEKNIIDNIYYIDDMVFYTYNNEVRYYNDEVCIRTLFVNTEFEFNNSLVYSVYKK